MKPRDAAALLPVLAGLAAMIVVQKALQPLPLLVIRIDFGLLAFLAGILVTALWLGIALARGRSESRRVEAIARERMKQAEAQRRFVRRLDHEMKNPLTGIRAALANLEGAGAAGAAPGAIPDIQHQVERLTRLTAGLRKLADLEEIPLEYAKFDLAALLQETVEAVRAHPAGTRRDLRLVVPSVPWPLPHITGDRDLLSLAFFNLIENALKFTGKEDTVEVRAMEQARHVQVEIADTGPGIPPEEIPRLFEELYRGSNARGCEGSGLGLALVRRVVERHEGSVTVRSRRDGGRGTVFAVTLPVSLNISHKSQTKSS
jgi:two-component system OmpR family sensor kinase